MIAFGIDTSNYASSLAFIDYKNNKILYQRKEFLPVETGKIGLRQQDAVFNHIKNLNKIFQLVQKEIDFNTVQAVGVSVKPANSPNSYMPCFLVGQLVAQSIAVSINVPLVQSSHQDGHINSALFYLNDNKLYNGLCIVFHISGGTTDMMLVKNGKVIETLGSSKDLFAGQAVDRLGVKLGYGFPAGEYVSDIAAECAEKIAKPKISVDNFNCNLSGLENQYSKMLENGVSKNYVAKYCLMFIGYTILAMAQNAKKIYGNIPFVFCGGVMSSKIIKEFITDNLENSYFVPPLFSQDNGIGVAAIAAREVLNG